MTTRPAALTSFVTAWISSLWLMLRHHYTGAPTTFRFDDGSNLFCATPTVFPLLLMASKYLCDSPYENVCWVSISDSTWTLAQINEMELTFLKHLHWNAHIAPDTLHEYAMQATAAVSILHLPLPLRKQAGMV
eukprot:Rmarinus@m.29553